MFNIESVLADVKANVLTACDKGLEEGMEIIKEELMSRYGIEIDEKSSEEKNEESDSEQLTMFEIVLLPTWFQTAAA